MKVLLHYVGKATYNEELFKKEARRYGVNRALPKALALKLKPGDIVLLAFKVKEGAKVIGYMVVSGYTLPNDIAKKVGEDIVDWQEGPAVIEHRGCGTIIISGKGYVKDWDALVERLKSIEENFKIFVAGKFYELQPFILNKKFTMSGIWIDVEKELPKERVEPLLRVFDEKRYQREPYRTDEEKRKLLEKYRNKNLLEWLK